MLGGMAAGCSGAPGWRACWPQPFMQAAMCKASAAGQMPSPPLQRAGSHTLACCAHSPEGLQAAHQLRVSAALHLLQAHHIRAPALELLRSGWVHVCVGARMLWGWADGAACKPGITRVCVAPARQLQHVAALLCPAGALRGSHAAALRSRVGASTQAAPCCAGAALHLQDGCPPLRPLQVGKGHVFVEEVSVLARLWASQPGGGTMRPCGSWGAAGLNQW